MINIVKVELMWRKYDLYRPCYYKMLQPLITSKPFFLEKQRLACVECFVERVWPGGLRGHRVGTGDKHKSGRAGHAL